jgi:hypothetical protein
VAAPLERPPPTHRGGGHAAGGCGGGSGAATHVGEEHDVSGREEASGERKKRAPSLTTHALHF